MARILTVLLLAFLAAGAGAQTVYKSIMPDGSVIYGEKPAAGAKRSRRSRPRRRRPA
jgi:hypothetical protein